MRSLFLLFSFVLLTTCSGNSVDNPNCRFLLEGEVNLPINLNLPEYSQLQFDLQSVYVRNVGNGGIIVINAVTSYLAWDASDPNHTPNGCVLKASGVNATCECSDKNTYSLINGQPLGHLLPNGDIEPDSGLLCSLKFYRVEQSGNNLLISN
jgi:hypothetical protein